MSMIGQLETKQEIDIWVSVQPSPGGKPIVICNMHAAHSTVQFALILTSSDEARSLGTYLLDAAQQIDLG